MPIRLPALAARWLSGNLKNDQAPPACQDAKSKLPSHAIPILSPAGLLLPFKSQLSRIQALAGTTQVHFETYYQATLDRYADHCQQRPALQTSHHHQNGLLRLGLETAIAALKVRQAYLLPPGSVPEEAVLKKDLWTFAVFTLALLHGLHEPALSQTVTLYKNDSEATWNPWPGSMSANPDVTGYAVEGDGNPNTKSITATSLLLAHQVIEPKGMAWLASDQRVFSAWVGCLSGNQQVAGFMDDILAKAWASLNREGGRMRSENPETINDEEVRSPESIEASKLAHENSRAMTHEPVTIEDQLHREEPKQEEAPAAKFVEWLREGLKAGTIPCNSPNARVHVVPEGVLLVTPNIFKDFVDECGGGRWEAVQKLFIKRKEHVKTASGENFHRISHTVGGSDVILTVLLLKKTSTFFDVLQTTGKLALLR